MSEPFHPWEILPEETAYAYARFTEFRDLGPGRTVSQVTRMHRKNRGPMDELGKRYSWHARARAWDVEVDRVRRESFLKLQRTTIMEHVKSAAEIRSRAYAAILKIPPEILATDPKVAIAWFQAAVKIEQQSLGMPTEVTQLSVQAGQTSDPAAAYWDSLPREKLLELSSIAVRALQSAEPAQEITDDSNARGHEEKA